MKSILLFIEPRISVKDKRHPNYIFIASRGCLTTIVWWGFDRNA